MLAVMMTSWGKQDLVKRYGVAPEKVAVVPWGIRALELSGAFALGSATPRATHLALPERFVLMPAQTWPHKNHMGLLEALAILRDEHGLQISAVCPGKQSRPFRSDRGAGGGAWARQTPCCSPDS